MVSRVRKIYREFRLWVIDRKVVTASLYKEGQTVVYRECPLDEDVIGYAKQFLTGWVPARAFVLDIFDTEDGYKIGEVNCLNAAGFYAADLQKLVLSLEEAFS